MSPKATHHHPGELTGILYAGAAYGLWGFVPLYWRLLADVPAVEITVHRVLWCAVFTVLVSLWRARLRHILAIFRAPRAIGALALTSLLISANWTLFIWCVSTHRLVEASLGYYMTPLVSIALGVLLLGESISRARLAAIGLATLAVAAKAVEVGHVPWIAPALALSFGFYGYLRKLTPVDALDGLTIETILLFPLTLAIVLFWAQAGVGAFSYAHPGRDGLLILGGPVTAVPLVLFAAGARRLRMTTLGFLQYVSPSITLGVATLLLGERFTRIDAVTFACVWAALLLVGLEGRSARVLARSAAPTQ
jgi:chloramphenicol-sensitive protein RarD